METRELKGLHLAATANIQRRGETWVVPSSRTNKKYTVRITETIQSCTCPDYEATHRPCKHIYAVRQILNPHPQPVEAPPPQPVPRPTYRQAWREYDLAQTHEKTHVQELLYGLCGGVEAPAYTFGRPRLPLPDMLFSLAMKVYCGFSSRRTISDLRAARVRGYLSRTPHFCSLAKYMEAAWITPYLHRLIIESALPLKAVETAFAVDSSGFSISHYDRWTTTKYGDTQLMEKQGWVKLHLICGVVTNVVTSCEVTEKYANDSPQFPALVSNTAKNFNLREVSGDKAYSSRDNLKLVKGYGATPYIDFKTNATGGATKDALWQRMYHFYAYNQEWFYRHYHKRSNVESTFSMIKAKFGGNLRSKTYTAQVNEALCKVLCHNLCCVIKSIYEMGIEPEFWNTTR